MKGNRMSGDDKGAGGGEDGSIGYVMDRNDGVRGGKGVKGVGIEDTSSESISDMADSGTISVTTCKKSDEDCVASSCDTDKVTSEG